MRAWIVLAVLSSSAIARAGGALKGDVLVGDDATFYVEPADDAATMKLVELDRSAMAKVIGHVVPMHVVGRHGDFVEVEAVADGQCVGSALEADGVTGLRLFVKEDALAPVLVKAWSAKFDDGSRVALGVGEPVMPLDAGGIGFRIDDVVVNADVPASSIGRAYPAITPATLAPDHPRFQLRAGATAKLAGQEYTVPAKVDLAHAARAIDHPRKDQTRFPIRTRCGELDVVVADDAVEPYQKRTEDRLRPFGRDDEYQIPEGTPVTTRAGRRAGVAATDIAVARPASGAANACFEAAVRIRDARDVPTDDDLAFDAKLELCALATAVRHTP